MKTFDQLWEELAEKVKNGSSDSATVASVNSGVHSIGKKVLEEAGEVWIAAEYQDDESLAEEISQLIYHLQVLMLARSLTPTDVYRYL